MYFGSVRFFKHLIIALSLLFIVIPIVICVNLNRQLQEKEKEIAKLKLSNTALSAFSSHYDASKELTGEDIYYILQELGIDNSELVQQLYEKDENAFKSILNLSVSANDVAEPEVEIEISEEGEPVEEQPEMPGVLKPYMSMYEHLYSDAASDSEYIEDDNYIYLTFDDGPSVYTNDILGYLDKWDVKATFFVIPTETEACQNYLSRMLADGHSVGIHTYTHDYKKIYASVESFLDDFNSAYNLIYEQTGYKPFLFRFPGGSINNYNKETYSEIIEEMTRRGFVYFDWNVDSEDALGADWNKIYYGVQEQIDNLMRSVVLFHDGAGNKNTAYAIDDVLRALIQNPKGYTFSTIHENTRPVHFNP